MEIRVWLSQTFPVSLSGTHALYLAFQTVMGGATGGNLVNLNWAEFNGPGSDCPRRSRAPTRHASGRRGTGALVRLTGVRTSPEPSRRINVVVR